MQLLTKIEFNLWLNNNKMNEDDIVGDGKYVHLNFRIPKDSGVKTYIARYLASLFENDCKYLCIKDFGVNQAAENRELFNGYRKSLGINQEVHENPAHFFSVNENIQLYCILSMLLYFVWGGIIVSQSKDIIVYLSHDEFVDIYLDKLVYDENQVIQINSLWPV